MKISFKNNKYRVGWRRFKSYMEVKAYIDKKFMEKKK